MMVRARTIRVKGQPSRLTIPSVPMTLALDLLRDHSSDSPEDGITLRRFHIPDRIDDYPIVCESDSPDYSARNIYARRNALRRILASSSLRLCRLSS